jgi:hypothetical protein
MSAASNPCIEFCHAIHGVEHWLHDWQTLISGFLALGAALWAGRLLQEQISQAEKFRQDEIKHRHNGSRVVLPLALASINELCREVSNAIAHEIEVRQNFDAAFDEATEHSALIQFKPVALAPEVISEMKGFAETLRGQKSVQHVGELMSSLQILASRYNSFDLSQHKDVVLHGLSELLIDAAKVGLLNDKMYNYGRFVDGKFAIVGRIPDADAWDMIHAKAEGLIFGRRIPDIFFEPLKARIDRYKKNNRSPWIEKFDG